MARLGVQALINVPIPDVFAGHGKWYGVMEGDSPREGAFSDDEVAFLQLYMNLIAAAVAQRKALAGMTVASGQEERLLAEISAPHQEQPCDRHRAHSSADAAS